MDRGPSPELARLRRRIDELDDRILALLSERARLSVEAGRIKTGGHGVPEPAPHRETEILERLALASSGPLRRDDLERILSTLFSVFRELQARDAGVPPGGK